MQHLKQSLWNFAIILFAIIAFVCFNSNYGYALTIEEAIQLAIENMPLYKSAYLKVKSSEALYNASLSPYLPVVDSFFANSKHYTQTIDYESRSYGLSLSYLLFDAGKRKANKEIARLNLQVDSEELNKTLIDLKFQVKNAFYTTLAFKETVAQRKIQLQDAQKDYEVADGRYKLGVAKLIDVLQASVRLEQAKFSLLQAEGDYNKAKLELNSIIGLPINDIRELKGSLETNLKLPEVTKLVKTALQRPEIKQAESLIKISDKKKSLILSEFFPSISASASYTKTDRGLQTFTIKEDKMIGISATWNLFELGKFFRKESAEIEKDISTEKLNEIKRVIQLETYRSYEDYQTAINKLNVAYRQLDFAEHNYKQAFGEYKVGKGDILTLVQAESALANAREQLINSKLSVIMAKSTLEKIVGIDKLELLDN
ncbi:MAG: TolC family protein [Thermodesulfovibrionales bacterium]|nr:TolC family protein [Thermodesulfovibrionales bacterium]